MFIWRTDNKGDPSFSSQLWLLRVDVGVVCNGGRVDEGVLGPLCKSTLRGIILGEENIEDKAGDLVASSHLDSSGSLGNISLRGDGPREWLYFEKDEDPSDGWLAVSGPVGGRPGLRRLGDLSERQCRFKAVPSTDSEDFVRKLLFRSVFKIGLKSKIAGSLSRSFGSGFSIRDLKLVSLSDPARRFRPQPFWIRTALCPTVRGRHFRLWRGCRRNSSDDGEALDVAAVALLKDLLRHKCGLLSGEVVGRRSDPRIDLELSRKTTLTGGFNMGGESMQGLCADDE